VAVAARITVAVAARITVAVAARIAVTITVAITIASRVAVTDLVAARLIFASEAQSERERNHRKQDRGSRAHTQSLPEPATVCSLRSSRSPVVVRECNQRRTRRP